MRRLFGMAARRKAPVVLASVLVLAIAGTAIASVRGTTLKMGISNVLTGNYITSFAATVLNAPGFIIRNNSTTAASSALRVWAPYGGVPLEVYGKTTSAPMRVNSGVKVTNLNADRLDDYHANSLVRAAVASSGTSGALFAITTNYPTYQDTITLNITAPTSGFVIVNAGTSVENAGGACTGFACGIFVRVQHSATSAISPYLVVDADNANSPDNAATVSYVFPVSAGAQAFILQMTRGSGATQAMSYFSANMNGLFIPFGSTGAGTLGISVQKPSGAVKGAGGLPK
jgi:hypothetical protein